MIPQHQISISTSQLHTFEDRRGLLGIYLSTKTLFCLRGEQILKSSPWVNRESEVAWIFTWIPEFQILIAIDRIKRLHGLYKNNHCSCIKQIGLLMRRLEKKKKKTPTKSRLHTQFSWILHIVIVFILHDFFKDVWVIFYYNIHINISASYNSVENVLIITFF